MKLISTVSILIILLLSVSEVLLPPLKIGFVKDLQYASGRIVVGQIAARYQFPYMVSIQRVYNHICGGALISENKVVTAAHCKMYGLGPYQAVVGMLNLKGRHRDEQRIIVRRFITFPSAVPTTISSEDIGLAILSTKANLGNSVSLIPLPTKEQCDSVGDIVLTGWGLVDSLRRQEGGNTNTTTIMRWTKMTPVTQEACARKLEELLNASIPLDSTMICAVGKPDSLATCVADSGGPLVYNGTLVGVVSWGVSPCGQEAAPVVSTRVCNHLEFITNPPIKAESTVYSSTTPFRTILIACIVVFVSYK